MGDATCWRSLAAWRARLVIVAVAACLVAAAWVVAGPQGAGAHGSCVVTVGDMTHIGEVINGSTGDDSIDCVGSDVHTVYMRGGNDVFLSGRGDDTVYGEAGNDLLKGRGGRDRLYGGVGGDTLVGGPARDRLFGGEGNDVLRGGGGDDILRGGPGADHCYGGAGIDTAVDCEFTHDVP
jgi:Ca2+-binding RTX toxin-like protein